MEAPPPPPPPSPPSPPPNGGPRTIFTNISTYLSENPGKRNLLLAGAAATTGPLLVVPALGALGFGAAGVVGGSLAAAAQSMLGSVGAGSVFAFCQSAAMGGYGAATLSAAATASGMATAAGAAAAAADAQRQGERRSGNENHSDSDSDNYYGSDNSSAPDEGKHTKTQYLQKQLRVLRRQARDSRRPQKRTEKPQEPEKWDEKPKQQQLEEYVEKPQEPEKCVEKFQSPDSDGDSDGDADAAYYGSDNSSAPDIAKHTSNQRKQKKFRQIRRKARDDALEEAELREEQERAIAYEARKRLTRRGTWTPSVTTESEIGCYEDTPCGSDEDADDEE